MALFQDSINDILRHEGVGLPGNPDGRVDNVNDPGGITAFGISFRFLKDHGIDIDHSGDINADDIRHLTKAEAIQLYQDYFWAPMLLDKVQDQMVAGKIFDIGVNMGTGWGIKLAQRAAVVCGQSIVIDGAVGPRTIAALNALPPTSLVRALQNVQAARYKELVTYNAKLAEFLTGWLKRASWPVLG